MKNLKPINLCVIIFLSQNLIGKTDFITADHEIELTIDLSIDSLSASIQLKLPIQENLFVARGAQKFFSVNHGNVSDRIERKRMDMTEELMAMKKSNTSVREMKPINWIFNHLMYLVLAGVALFALLLMWKDEKTIAGT